jgi:hypothetical protein
MPHNFALKFKTSSEILGLSRHVLNEIVTPLPLHRRLQMRRELVIRGFSHDFALIVIDSAARSYQSSDLKLFCRLAVLRSTPFVFLEHFPIDFTHSLRA